MINVGCVVKVIDNSGAKYVKCLRVLGVGKRQFARIGDVVVVSVQKRNPIKKIKKGQVLRALIVRTNKSITRRGGSLVRFDDNAVVIINNKNMKMGSIALSQNRE